MFLMQYFCLHGIRPFSKLYPEIESSTWPTATCRGKKSFELCVSFLSKSKAINVFPKHILKSKARDQSIQAKKKLFCHVIVRNYLCNLSWKFLIKIESTWRREIKELGPQLTLTYRGRTARSSDRSCIKKLLLDVLQYPQETPVLKSIFKKVAGL